MNQEKRYFALKQPFAHPYMTYQIGDTHSALTWADRLGHRMTEEEFIELVETDDRFKPLFEEVIPMPKQTKMNTEQWLKDKLFAYNQNPQQTLAEMLVSTTEAIEQYVNAPNKASKGVLDACLLHNALFLKQAGIVDDPLDTDTCKVCRHYSKSKNGGNYGYCKYQRDFVAADDFCRGFTAIG